MKRLDDLENKEEGYGEYPLEVTAQTTDVDGSVSAVSTENKQSNHQDANRWWRWAKAEVSLQALKKPASSSNGTLSVTPASRNRYGLMTPKRRTRPVNEKALNQLLRFVVKGEQDKVEALIKKDKSLLLAAGTVTDLAGREFKQITAFQYALWAWDWHMWEICLKNMPREAAAEQFKALQSVETAHGKHFDLQSLISTLQVYVNYAEKVWKYDQRAVDHWRQISDEQKLLPVSVINQYCRRDRSFRPCPPFTENSLPRTRQFFDRGDWYSPNLTGVVRGIQMGPAIRQIKETTMLGSRIAVEIDIKALQSLFKTRTHQLERLSHKLLSPRVSWSPLIVTL